MGSRILTDVFLTCKLMFKLWRSLLEFQIRLRPTRIRYGWLRAVPQGRKTIYGKAVVARSRLVMYGNLGINLKSLHKADKHPET